MADERTLEKVRKLLNVANKTTSAAERNTFLSAANDIMAKHAIDLAMLDATRTSGEKRKPTSKKITLYDSDFVWGPYFYDLIHTLARVNRCHIAWHGHYDSITVVGMQEDVEWVEMLWLNSFLHFSSKINPKWEVGLTLQENIFNFKHAGYKWKDIWQLGYIYLNAEMPDGGSQFVPNKCGYMKTMYHRECKKREVSPVGTQTFEAYKMTFVLYFTHSLKERLREQEEANKKQEEATPGSAVALYDVSKLVEMEFFRLFPQLTEEAKNKRHELAVKSLEDAEKRDAEYLASLSPATRRLVLNERLAVERKRERESDRYARNAAKKRTYDAAGATAGRVAAQEVDISSRQTAAPSGSRTEIA